LKDLGLFSSIVGHLGDGNFHEAIMYHKSDPIETAAVEKHVKNMITRALEMDGTSTVGADYIFCISLLTKSIARASIRLDYSRSTSYSRRLGLILWR